MIPPSTPILETLETLKIVLDPPAHIRTAGDLLEALRRKELEISPAAAKKIQEFIR